MNDKVIITGTVICDDPDIENEWYFETEEKVYSADVCCALDEILDRNTKNGEKYKIIIERL